MPDYQKTKVACYLGFVTQAISANFAPLLFLKFHNDYDISLGNIALISTFFFFTQLLVDFCEIPACTFSVSGLSGPVFCGRNTGLRRQLRRLQTALGLRQRDRGRAGRRPPCSAAAEKIAVQKCGTPGVCPHRVPRPAAFQRHLPVD